MDERWLIDGTPSARFPVYSRANTGEVLPDPSSPLGWTLVWLPGVVEGWADGHVSLGTFERHEFGEPPEPCDVFGGYLYINVSVARTYGERTPGASAKLIDDVFFGDHPDVPAYVPHPDDVCDAASTRMVATLQWVLGAASLPELLDDRREVDGVVAARPDLAHVDDAALVARARSVVPLVRRLFDRHFVVSASAAFGPGVAGATLAELGHPEALLALLAGIGDVDSAAPAAAMWELSRMVRRSPELAAAFDAGVPGVLQRLSDGARGALGVEAFRRRVDDFCFEFGSRGPNEWDISSPTWGTAPEIALVAVERMRHLPDSESPQVHGSQMAAERELLLEKLLADATPEQAEQLQRGVRSGQVFLAGRERTKTNIIRAIHEIRLAVLELGRRMVERGVLAEARDVCMLLDAELDGFVADPAAYRDRIRERRAEHAHLSDLEPPWVVNGVAPPLSSWAERGAAQVVPVEVGEVLHGGASAPGVATGRARVIHHPTDGMDLEPGEVLVAPVTDPSWTPLFVTAAAVVVDVGAMGSHAMIVSRELGIPCVASVHDATRRIPDGALVTVDGAAGTVRVDALPELATGVAE